MTQPRRAIVSVADTPYYHIVSRCVRRAFLCGFDKSTKRSYEHRRRWIEDRIRILSSVFTIDICSYAIMSNHIHLCLKLNPVESKQWSPKDIADRWCAIFKGPIVIRKWREGANLTKSEQEHVSKILEVYRDRLTSLSWFMKCLNEPIAKQANREDDCTGHFWEARYKSQALRTEEALLACMAYVDLNPVRANMAKSPESSLYTSIKERIRPAFDFQRAVRTQISTGQLFSTELSLKPLLHFNDTTVDGEESKVPFDFCQYLSLLKDTGRIIKEDRSCIESNNTKPLFDRLNVQFDTWVQNATQFEKNYRVQFGSKILPSNLKAA